MIRLFRHVPALAVPAWVVLAKLTSFATDSARLAALALAAAALACVSFLETRAEASPIHKGMAAYLAAGTAFFWFWPESAAAWLARFPVPALYAVLLLVAGVPPLLGQEVFTIFFARRTTPPAVWQTDVFRTINRHLTALWALLFAAGIASSLVPALSALKGAGWEILFEGLLPGALMLAIGLPANKHYPPYYQRRRGIDPALLASTPATADAETLEKANLEIDPPSPMEEKSMNAKPTVVAVNGSPHAGVGNTALMIEMLRPALAAEGFALEVITLTDHAIEYCTGCAWCLDKGRCWIPDDHAGIVQRLLDADGIILASPVYFFHVTAQMKTFLDRSLAFGHKPQPTWKPGLAVSVSAGSGETAVSEYLAFILRVYGAYAAGRLTALATAPGDFIGKQALEARAADLARDLARAVREKRRYPATDMDLRYYQFMSALVRENAESMMRDDHEHWEKLGLNQGFEAYIQQPREKPQFDPSVRKAWVKEMMAQHKAKRGAGEPSTGPKATGPASSAGAVLSCRELIQAMPQVFNANAAAGLDAVYQFEVSGAEAFTAHLAIGAGACVYREGRAAQPNVVIKTPAEVWAAISTGRLDGQQAFMAGKYKVEGDIMLLMRLKSLFPAAR
jgi:multimeric flavodoxin WrbA/putative sterol carrier protein